MAVASSSPQRNKPAWRSRLVLASALFSIAVIVLWVIALGEMNHLVAMIGATYALCCFGFLLVQLFAFLKAHMDYDQSIENPKFDVIKEEAKQWSGLKI